MPFSFSGSALLWVIIIHGRNSFTSQITCFHKCVSCPHPVSVLLTVCEGAACLTFLLILETRTQTHVPPLAQRQNPEHLNMTSSYLLSVHLPWTTALLSTQACESGLPCHPGGPTFLPACVPRQRLLWVWTLLSGPSARLQPLRLHC